MKKLLVLFLLLSACQFKVQNDQSVFYKSDYAERLRDYQSFPINSWNYLVLTPDQELSEPVWTSLADSFPLILSQNHPKGLDLFLKDWRLDYVFFEPVLTYEELDKKFKAALTRAQFLEMIQAGAIQWALQDPFSRVEAYLKLWSESHFLESSKEKQDYKFIPLLPVDQFEQSRSVNWKQLFDLGLGEDWFLIGPKYFSHTNKTVILKDLKRLTKISCLLALFLLFILFFFRLYKVFVFVPLIGGAVFLALLGLQFFLGGVHGLVLAFGSSIVGLSLDYGVHAVFSKEKKRLWKKNFVAFFTTILSFVVLSFSSLPLFRQLALFAILGLSLSFTLMWLFDSRFSIFQRPLKIGLPQLNLPRGLSGVFLVFLVLILFVNVSKNTKDFLYVGPQEKKILSFLESKQKNIFVKMQNKNKESKPSPDVFGLKTFVSPPSGQEMRWKDVLSSYPETGAFKNFVGESLDQIKKGFNAQDRLYASMFLSGEKEILFFHGDQKKRPPEYWSPTQYVDEMGADIFKELCVLFLVALVISILFLFFLFKNLVSVFKVFFPFLSFLSFLSLYLFISGLSLNLIHLVGAVMVFGLSIDYGVFGLDSEKASETLSAFLLSAGTSFLGFFPLLFSQHPVLFDLGVVLVIGIVSALISGLFLLMKNSHLES